MRHGHDRPRSSGHIEQRSLTDGAAYERQRTTGAACVCGGGTAVQSHQSRQFRVGVTRGVGVVMGAPCSKNSERKAWPQLGWL